MKFIVIANLRFEILDFEFRSFFLFINYFLFYKPNAKLLLTLNILSNFLAHANIQEKVKKKKNVTVCLLCQRNNCYGNSKLT